MIAKMQHISISGHISGMNHVISNYLSRYDIELEHTDTRGLMTPFSTLNPYAATLQKAETLAEHAGNIPLVYLPLPEADAVNIVEDAYKAYESRSKELRGLQERLATTREYIRKLENFTEIDACIVEIENFWHIHHRFGRLPATHFLQYEKFLADSDHIIFVAAKRDKDFVWGVYFTPAMHAEAVDATFASLKFEPIAISAAIDEYTGNTSWSEYENCTGGTPHAIIRHWQSTHTQLQNEISTLSRNILNGTVNRPQRLAIACRQVKNLYSAFDVKKFANISPGGSMFTFSGWMTEKDAQQLEAEIDGDNLTLFSYNDTPDVTPPTLLTNPPVVRQFEFFTGLYGLPANGEIDPTPILAITYTLLFGLMFGDVGHGAALVILGLFIRHRWRVPLGGIMATAGASAIVFGFLYGSIFGFEDILPALWRRPAENIGGTLMFAVWLGVGLIVLSMLLNMYVSFKRRRVCELLFGANGVAGLVFYGAVLLIAVRVFVQGLPITGVVVSVAVFPLVFVAFRHPLERFMAGKNPIGNGVGEFAFGTVIELFETLLTYITNTISFVRVGAFAVSHAGMMHVVLQLSQGAAGRNWVILILGNVLVLVIEGLLVGIQVLRLDFYEIFSRFYTGGGRRFAPNRIRE